MPRHCGFGLFERWLYCPAWTAPYLPVPASDAGSVAVLPECPAAVASVPGVEPAGAAVASSVGSEACLEPLWLSRRLLRESLSETTSSGSRTSVTAPECGPAATG